MKEKILAQLVKAHPGVSKVVLEKVAEKMATTVTDEAGIDTAIADLDKLPISIKDYAELLQKDGDRRVTEALKKAKEEKKDPPKDDPKKDDDPKAAGEDATAKALAAIQSKLEALEKKGTTASLTDKLHKLLTEKKLPVALAKGRIPESEEELEGVVTEIEADYTEMKQSLANEGFTQTSPPVTGSPASKNGAAIEADIKNWSATRKAESGINTPAPAPAPGK